MNSKNHSLIQVGCFMLTGIVYILIKLHCHELWKDEWQPWLLVRDKSFTDLLNFLHNEGHPALWFAYLEPWAFISNLFKFEPDRQVAIFSIAHSLLFFGTMFIVLFRFKMQLLFRIGLLCSFFFFYEYGIVNRGYILLILLYYYLITQLKTVGITSRLVAVLLFLLCQTEVYGVFISMSFFLLFWFDFYKKENKISFLKNRAMLENGIAMLLGIISFVVTVFPRGSANVIGVNIKTSFIENLGHAVQGNFSNTFLIGLMQDTNVFGVTIIGLISSLLVLISICFFFLKDKGLLLSFLVYMLAVVVFGTLIYNGGVRHWGINFIFFFGLAELYSKRNKNVLNWQLSLVGLFMIFQLSYNCKAIDKEIKFAFSNAKATANFITEKVPSNVPIISINQFETAPVVAYLGRDVYTLPKGEPFTFYHWLDKVYLPSEREMKLFAQYKNKSGVVILSPKPLEQSRYPNVELWETFEGYNLKNENYFLYLLSVK